MAWIGLVGCLLVVFVFSSSLWWNGVVSFTKVASVYASVRYLQPVIELLASIALTDTFFVQPIIFLVLWIVRKITVRRHEHQPAWFVRLDDDFAKLTATFERLEYTKPTPRDHRSHRRDFWIRRLLQGNKPAVDNNGVTQMAGGGHLTVNQGQVVPSGSSTAAGDNYSRPDLHAEASPSDGSYQPDRPPETLALGDATDV
jgi:hypothetical protein